MAASFCRVALYDSPMRRGLGLRYVKRWLREAGCMLGVWYAVLLHLAWAVALLVSPTSLRATAIHGPAELFPNRFGLALLLAVVAASAVGGIFREMGTSKILLLIPQQVMLGMSAASAIHAMVAGHFADGVPRPQPFIFADQLPAVLALLVHSLSILFVAAMVNGWLSDAPAPKLSDALER